MSKKSAAEDRNIKWFMIPLTVPYERKDFFKEKYGRQFLWFNEPFRCWFWFSQEELPEDLRSYIHPTFAEKSHPSKPRLSIELIPRTCWFSNARSHVTPEKWKTIRDFIFYPKGHKCEICCGQGDHRRVDCHEVFHYDEITRTQKLVGLRAVCPSCHLVKHFRNDRSKEAEIAFAHLCKVNEWTREKAQKYVEEQFKLYRKRSRIKWNLDLSFLARHFDTVVTPESALQRSERAALFRIKDYWKAQTLESLLEDQT